MHVVFIEPGFPSNQREFVRGLRAAGARVTGIGERPLESLDGDLRFWLYNYIQVPTVVHEAGMVDVVRRLTETEPVERIEATVEAHVMVAARIREALDIPGTSTRTTWLCRDKPAMKEVLREAGIPTAQSAGADSADEVREFAARVGYPLILKPRDGAGASGTVRVTGEDELERALQATPFGRTSIAVEEFVDGHEGFFDTITINGKIEHDFVCHYYPNVLQAMRTRWISPQFIATNRLDEAPGYAEVRALGQKVIDALEIGTSATHMEWFFGPKGLKFSEIGCRPPGVGAWDLYCAGNDMDLYTEWGHAIVKGKTEAKPSRSHAAGIVTLRPERDGQISGYGGLEEIQEQFGQWILDSHIPHEGTPTQPVEAGYMANAWIRMRHPDFDELRRMLNVVGETVTVRVRG